MTKYEQYNKFCEDHKHDEQEEFFENLSTEFQVSDSCAYDLWYAPQRIGFLL